MSFRVEGLFVLSGEIEDRVEIKVGNWAKHKKTHFFLNDIISIFDAYYFVHYHHKQMFSSLFVDLISMAYIFPIIFANYFFKNVNGIQQCICYHFDDLRQVPNHYFNIRS
jgi:hypothetical protein